MDYRKGLGVLAYLEGIPEKRTEPRMEAVPDKIQEDDLRRSPRKTSEGVPEEIQGVLPGGNFSQEEVLERVLDRVPK